jgi:hypothetical protein
MNKYTNQPQRYTNETETKTEKLPNGIRVLIALGITALAAITISAGLSTSHSIRGSDNPEKFGKLNGAITDVVLENGARLRHDPTTGDNDSNLIEILDADKPLTIETPDGAYVDEGDPSANGAYYGIKSEDLEKAIPGFDAQGDNDGVIWINTQKATPEYEDKK